MNGHKLIIELFRATAVTSIIIGSGLLAMWSGYRILTSFKLDYSDIVNFVTYGGLFAISFSVSIVTILTIVFMVCKRN